MLNIVIPMAGMGSRFVKAGYSDPKPFIPINGKPMIQRVIENLIPYEPHRFIFLARRDHKDYIEKHMRFITNVIYVDKVTEGAACTVLLAKDLIDNDDSLIIANSDQIVEWNDMSKVEYCSAQYANNRVVWKESNNIQDMINCATRRYYSAMIATFDASHPKWSYAKVRDDGLVIEVAEKKAISNKATVGIYYYKHGRAFVKYAEQMIAKDIRVNGEFYVCPVFNEFIESALTIGIYPIRTMMGLGTPEDLERYLNEVAK